MGKATKPRKASAARMTTTRRKTSADANWATRCFVPGWRFFQALSGSALGYSPTEIQLKISREEIGNYLGLKLETVSRTFSKLQNHGLLAVERRNLRIGDLDGLKRLIDFGRCDHP